MRLLPSQKVDTRAVTPALECYPLCRGRSVKDSANMQALQLLNANSTPDGKTNYMTESRYILDITAHWVASLKLRYSTR